jgi:hypothetical protein
MIDGRTHTTGTPHTIRPHLPAAVPVAVIARRLRPRLGALAGEMMAQLRIQTALRQRLLQRVQQTVLAEHCRGSWPDSSSSMSSSRIVIRPLAYHRAVV